MKIVSFVRTLAFPKPGSAKVDHGIVLDDCARFVDVANVPSLAQIPSDERLNHLLTMTAEDRAFVSAECAMRNIEIPQSNLSAEAEIQNLKSKMQVEPLDSVHLRPASPFCPVYLLMHGNAPMIFKLQNKGVRWKLPRVPYPRVRPWTSHLGHDEELVVPEGASLNHGAELGVVISKPAYRVPEDQARSHIAGFTVLDDGYLYDMHKEFILPPDKMSPYQDQALATLYKGGDGIGMMGPWITTAEEVGDHYDLLLYTYTDGQRQNRSWSGSYLMLAEFLIMYFSRSMTLSTGAIISLGAAGWDGSPTELAKPAGSRRTIEVEIERIGKLRTPLHRVDEVRESPAVARLRALGLPEHRPAGCGPAVWVLRSAYRESDVVEGIGTDIGMCPNLYPPKSLADGSPALVIPPHATDIRCSVQLAAVIGEKPVYRATRENALDFVAGVAPVIAVRDTSLLDTINNPTAYEQRASYFLGCGGDGFIRIGATRPLSAAGELSRRRMRLAAAGIGEMEYSTANYRFGLAQMITMVSRIGTLMPGDVLSLGVAGRELTLPADRIGAARRLEASIEGLGEIVVTINDERDPARRDPEKR